MGIAYRYYKFTFASGNNTSIMIKEIELRGADGLDFTTSGMTVTADGYYAAGYEPNKAYDNTASQWQYNAAYPHWHQIDLGVGNAKEIKTYVITGSDQNTYTPTNWVLYGSNDAVNYTQLASVTGLSWTAGEVKNFGVLTISGTVLNEAGLPVSRVVRAYRRSDGALISSTTSDPSTGAWSVSGLDNTTEMFVVCFDIIPGAGRNALIYDQVLAT